MIKDRSQIYKTDLHFGDQNDARVIASNFIENRAIVLDVGCACGDFGIFLSKYKHCVIYGMEYDPISIQIAAESRTYKDLKQVDLNKFDTADYKDYYGFFDYITLLDVLEHTLDPDQVLLKLKKFLKKDGSIIVSLPNVSFGEIKINLLIDNFTYTETGILDQTHLKFFTFKTIIYFFTNLNFEISESRIKVSDFATNIKTIPFCIRSYIKKDPHSYAYQYVIKVSSTQMSKDELLKINTKKMELKWNRIRQELRMIRKHKWASKIFPEGSKRRELVKVVYKVLFKKGN